jgi:cytochrome P450/NADPH-cytochrome P450 reductase
MIDSPEAYKTAQKEVDSVLGNRSIQFEDLRKLRYCNAMVRETLRLQPTAPTIALNSKTATESIGGKYGIKKSDVVMIALHAVHRDPAVYGEDAEEWKPERMLDENFDKLPPHAWKAFGNGVRGCIGRTFVHQEALITIALLLQSFDFQKDPEYELRIQSNISIKPRDFSVHASLRNGLTPSKVEQMLAGKADETHAGLDTVRAGGEAARYDATLVPFTILYGSNSGTCEALARKLAADAAPNGFRTCKVDSLDSLMVSRNGTPRFGNEPVVIITASYDGQPPQNATKFCSWLSGLSGTHELHFPHAVFGAGHSDWKDTFFRVPTDVDDQLTAHGSRSLCDRGSANASEGDMINDFQRWEDHVLWPAMRKHFQMGEQSQTSKPSSPSSFRLDISSGRPSHLRMDVSEAKVTCSRSWKAPGLREKRHIELELPTSIPPHRAGDYLAVLPLNPEQTVRRVFNRFGLCRDSTILVHRDTSTSTSTNLPTDVPISAHLLFSAYLELAHPASRPDMSLLISCAQDDETRSALQRLDANFASQVTSQRGSTPSPPPQSTTQKSPSPTKSSTSPLFPAAAAHSNSNSSSSSSTSPESQAITCPSSSPATPCK